MAKTRSPGYPVIGLREAIEKIQAVYAKDYQNKIPREVLAEHMGYRSLNGKSLGVLSALAKYGLLQGRGDGNSVSDLALAIIAHSPGDPERVAAITEAASKPELFAELDAKFAGGRASDGAIRSYLLTQKFIPQAADASIRSYRETKGIIDEERSAHNGDVSEDEPLRSSGPMQPNLAPIPASGISMLSGEQELMRGALGEGGFRILVTGKVTVADLTDLISMVTLQKEILARHEHAHPARSQTCPAADSSATVRDDD